MLSTLDTISIKSSSMHVATVWSPALYHQHNIAKLEMVQRRVARFVTNNYDRTASVTQMLHSLQWDTLEARRNNLRAVLLYKIINKMAGAGTYTLNNQKDYLCLQTALHEDIL